MDFVEVIRLYIKEMVAMAGPGMKVMLMDRETTSIVSCAYAQSEMMQREVYLFERLDAPNAFEREPIGYLKCIALLRPTPDNVQRLATELRRPKYAQYYIFWTNIISKTDVKTLAEADEQETVREMHEIFVDTIPLAPHFAVAPGVSSDSCFEASVQLAPSALRRAKETLVSALLALNRSPLIRYEKTAAGDAQRLAEDVAQVIRREDGLFENAKSGQTVVLILERAHDPVTPLLNQWTYEAMVHELLGITNNRVTLDDQSIVLSAQHDHFYAQNQFSNFGEIGTAIKQLMADFQQKAHVSKQIESVADMKQFVDEYPQFKKMSGTVTKHVALMSELSRQVARQNLLELSELEQSIVADGEHARCLERIRALIEHEKTTEQNALRLVMLYALRFEHYANNDLRGLVDLLKRRGNARAHALVASLLRYAGAQRRSNDLFGQASVGQFTKRLIKGLKGVENIYTQHQPFLEQVLEQFCRGRLADAAFPWVSTSESSAVNPSRVDQVVVFMIGGATFEESAAVRAHNARRATAAAGVLIPSALLVSTHTLNTETFMQQLGATLPNTAVRS